MLQGCWGGCDSDSEFTAVFDVYCKTPRPKHNDICKLKRLKALKKIYQDMERMKSAKLQQQAKSSLPEVDEEASNAIVTSLKAAPFSTLWSSETSELGQTTGGNCERRKQSNAR